MTQTFMRSVASHADRRHVPAALAVFAIAAVVAGTSAQLIARAVASVDTVPWGVMQNGYFAIGCAVLGGLLSPSAAARSVGILLLVTGVAGGTSILLAGIGEVVLLRDTGGAVPLHWFSEVLWPLFVAAPLTLLPLLFPSGLMRGWIWRVLACLTLTVILGLIVSTAIHQETSLGDGKASLANPLAVPEVARALVSVLNPLLGFCVLAGIAALVVRFVGGSRQLRQQILLLAITFILNVAILAAAPLLPSSLYGLLILLGPLLILGAIAHAVLRFELYDLGFVLNRALVYATLTVLLTALFVVASTSALAVASRVPFAPAPWAAGAVAAVVVVLCAEPLRRRLQRHLEHRLLGDRRRPLAAMARLRESTTEEGDDAIVASIATTIADSVRSPGVIVSLTDPADAPTSRSASSGETEVIVPLLHRQEWIGEVRVKRRSPGEEYGARDRELLQQLAAEAATILYGVRQERELASARREAITIAAEERARLGRDLHDGLGPLLAGASLTTEALRSSFVPGSADELDAAKLAQRLRSAAGDIRRIARELQPSPLSDRTLTAALREYAQSVRGPDVPVIVLEIRADDLPQAVAEAAYFVVLESVNNVIKHAAARTAGIVIVCENGSLTIDVSDDGVGLAYPYISGVGLTSLRRRVTALGGSFDVGRSPIAGTRILARIPVPE